MKLLGDKPSRRLTVCCLTAAALSVLVGCSSGNSGGSPGGASGSQGGASALGVSANQILIGYIDDFTGGDSEDATFASQAVKARIALANANGGIDGRKIKLITADSGSTPNSALTAAESLVNKQHVFAVISNSGFLFGASSFLTHANAPVTGTGIDGPEWGDPHTANMFDAGGAPSANNVLSAIGQFFKSQGANRVGTLSYAASPSSVNAAKNGGKSAANAGLQNPINDTSAVFTTDDMTPQALNMKKADVEGEWAVFAQTQSIGLSQALQQQGMHLKALLVAEGYNAIPAASSAAAQGLEVMLYAPPVESGNKAVLSMMAAIHKYSPYTQADYSGHMITGWLAADLMVTGLKLAGKNPTRDGFENALHNLSHYTAGGLFGAAVNLKQSLQGTWAPAPAMANCFSVVKYEGTKYVPLNNGKPYCGTVSSG